MSALLILCRSQFQFNYGMHLGVHPFVLWFLLEPAQLMSLLQPQSGTLYRWNREGYVRFYFCSADLNRAYLYWSALRQGYATPSLLRVRRNGHNYHYNDSPQDLKQVVFSGQFKQAVELGKPMMIHTREAEADTERIPKEEMLKEYTVRTHAFKPPHCLYWFIANSYTLFHGLARVR